MGRADEYLPGRVHQIGKAGVVVEGEGELVGCLIHAVLLHHVAVHAVGKGCLHIAVEDVFPRHAADMRGQQALPAGGRTQRLSDALIVLRHAAEYPAGGRVHRHAGLNGAVELQRVLHLPHLGCGDGADTPADTAQNFKIAPQLHPQGVCPLLGALGDGADRVLPELGADVADEAPGAQADQHCKRRGRQDETVFVPFHPTASLTCSSSQPITASSSSPARMRREASAVRSQTGKSSRLSAPMTAVSVR